MVPHNQEHPAFIYAVETERQALVSTKALRGVPQKASNRLLTATWNLTNFGLQKRTDGDLALMAEIISWFDLVAIQEIADSLIHLRLLLSYLPASFRVILSDIGGNDERAGFLYDSDKLTRLELAAEVAVPPSDRRYIRLKGVSGAFEGFDRNPYAVAFRAGALEFTAVCAHLFFGSHAYYDQDRRALEAYALARWADQRHKAAGAYSQNILVLGDLNLPIRGNSSNVYKALKAKRLILPQHSTSMGSNLAGDKDYDQVAFHAGGMQEAYGGHSGVFDFDHDPFFTDAWTIGPDYFNNAVKYHIADHRPLWAEFEI
ncbi:endonuclease/exonuclease/phosphatase family protein [Sedimenticola selenatireducens]|uniref:endonuclease/exonuclease/phosphatase family protein n=1 Tax=Sedimenticola selenatireducens TaxID=191960 RepID=UPI002AAC4C6F|nr:endonuclease/exonuclease/phosphatase family protein [Sedimenticola selenatireducens]